MPGMLKPTEHSFDEYMKGQTTQKPLLRTTCRACGRIFTKMDERPGSSICPCGYAIAVKDGDEWKMQYSGKKLLF